jgi:IMP dehydrogenase
MALDITSDGSSQSASRIEEALAFDDVLLVPGYSQILPSAAEMIGMLSEMVRVSLVRVSVADGRIFE